MGEGEGVHEKPIANIKGGTWTVCRFEGGAWQERRGGGFEGEVDRLMHNVLLFWTKTFKFGPIFGNHVLFKLENN